MLYMHSRLIFFLLDESGLFFSNTFKKNRCWFVIRVLGHQFTLNSPLEYAVTKLLTVHYNSILKPRIF